MGAQGAGCAFDDRPASRKKMLERFYAAYEQADVVTAHNIRGHDLPIVQAHLAELQMPLLEPKLAHDTLKDLRPKWKDISRSQENLCEMLGISAREAPYESVTLTGGRPIG